MLCPTCTTERLVIAERRGIEIDHCPKCRGIWLDRGELDKLIERSEPSYPAASGDRDDRVHYRDHDDDDDDWKYRNGTRTKKKRGGFLGDLFDF